MKKLLTLGLLLSLAGCSNYPYPKAEGDAKTIWYSFTQEDPRSFDPQTTYDSVSDEILYNITEGLYEYNYLKRSHLVLQPALATAMPTTQLNPDGTETFTIQLKKNIHFQDDPCFLNGKGREVTVDDIIYSLQRIADPFIKTPTSSQVFDPLAAEIVGLQEFYDAAQKKGAADYSLPISGVKKIDRYTFEIRTKEPYPQLKYWMALHFFAPTAKEAVAYYDGQTHDGVRRDQFMFHPVGTGPYKLKTWDRNQRIILERNKNYNYGFYPSEGEPGDKEKGLLVDAGKPLPFVDELYFTNIREGTSLWNLFRQGYLDSLGRNGLGQDSFQQAVSVGKDLTPDFAKTGVHLEKVVQLASDGWVFNMNDPIVGKNKKLRQALSMAFNSQRFIDTFYNGIYVKADGVVPPGITGYDPAYKNPYGIWDINKAKQLLKEAGYPDGIDPKTGQPLTIEFVMETGSPKLQQIAQFAVQQFDSIGVRAKPKLVTFSERQNIGNKGNFQMTLFIWSADYPDPENFYMLFYSKNAAIGLNLARYNNPKFDQLYLKIKSMEDSPERLALLDQMRDMLNEDCPWIFVEYWASYTLSQPWTANYVYNPIAYTLGKYRRVDTIMREQKQKEWNQPNYLFAIALVALALGAIVPLTLRKDK